MVRVLVVESEATVRKNIANALEVAGFEVYQAANGQAAVERLESIGPVAVVVLDIILRGVSGWTVLDFLQSEAKFSGVKVIIVSTYEQIARSANPHLYLSKPVDTTQLIAAIQRFT